MSDCPRNDMRNLHSAVYSITDELMDAGADATKIAQTYKENIDKMIKGEEVASFSEFGSGWGKKVDNFFDNSADKIKAAAVWSLEKGGVSTAAAKAFVREGVAVKLVDHFNYAHIKFKNNLELNAADNAKKLSQFSKEEIKGIYEFLHGWKDLGELAEHTRSAATSLRNIIKANADELVRLGALMAEDSMENYVKHYFSEHVEAQKSAIRRQISNYLKGDKHYKRKELSREELEKIGLMEDEFAIVNTIKEQFLQIERAKRLKELAGKFSSAKEIDGWVLFGLKNGKPDYDAWGALAGRYVPEDMATALNDINVAAKQIGVIEEILPAIVSHLKMNLTAKNPATHVYNFASNLGIAAIKGDLRVLYGTLKMFANEKTRAQYRAWERLAQENGLSVNMDAIDMAGRNGVVEKDKGKLAWLKRGAKELYMAQGTVLGDVIRAGYNFEDAVFKIAHFRRIMEKEGFDISKVGDAAYKKSFEGKLSAAMKNANYEYVDYATGWNKFAKGLDKYGVYPFVQYAWKSTPMILRTIAKNPIKASLMIGAIGAGKGLTIQNRDEKNNLKPDWAQNGLVTNLFGADAWVRLFGSEYYFNLGRLIPAIRLNELGGLKDGGFHKTFWNLLNGKTGLGYDYVKKDAPISEKAMKFAEELSKAFMPAGTYGRYGVNSAKLTWNAIADMLNLSEGRKFSVIKDSAGNDLNFGLVVARALGVRELPIQKGLQTTYTKTIKALKEAQKEGDKDKVKEIENKIKVIKAQAKTEKITLKEPRK